MAASPAASYDEADGYVRIREAAIALFADRGVAGVSVRDIAAAAGVSSGLIRHHFGSKEQLREECDRHVFEQALATRALMLERLASDPAYVPAYDETTFRYSRYMGRATMDGSPAAERHFEAIADATTRWFETESGRDYPDPRGMAVIMTSYAVGSLALLDQMARSLGFAPGDPALMSRIATASAAIFAAPLFPEELVDRMNQLARSAPKEHS